MTVAVIVTMKAMMIRTRLNCIKYLLVNEHAISFTVVVRLRAN